MANTDIKKLISLACSFNNDFQYFITSNESRILPKLKTGITQKPINNIYWQKECGCFSENNGDLMSLENPDYVSDIPDWIEVSSCDIDGYKCGISYSEKSEAGGTLINTGHYKPVKPRINCLMYVGEWCYLERHEDVVNRENQFWGTIKNLKNHHFNLALRKHIAYPFFIRNTRRVTLHDNLKGSHNDDWLLSICILRVVAGAIEMHDNPLREEMQDQRKQKALDANLGKLLLPDQRTANAARRLIAKIKSSGGEIDWIQKLKDIAERKPYPLINSTEPKLAFVREISLLSKMYLNTSNGHKGRFPATAIQNILEFINEEMTDSGIQYHLERYDDSNQKPLSSGYKLSDFLF